MFIQDALEVLKDRGAGRPASEAVAALDHAAFRDFGPQCLWSRRPSVWPTFTQAPTIADGLRRERNLRARALAETIERTVRAAL